MCEMVGWLVSPLLRCRGWLFVTYFIGWMFERLIDLFAAAYIMLQSFVCILHGSCSEPTPTPLMFSRSIYASIFSARCISFSSGFNFGFDFSSNSSFVISFKPSFNFGLDCSCKKTDVAKTLFALLFFCFCTKRNMDRMLCQQCDPRNCPGQRCLEIRNVHVLVLFWVRRVVWTSFFMKKHQACGLDRQKNTLSMDWFKNHGPWADFL